MPIMPFNEMMARARKGRYAVGYFESWNMESLLAVADAAKALRSPVILGFSGIRLPDPRRLVAEGLGDYAALGLAVCRRLSVPVCLLFNESADMDWLLEAVQLGFHLVMFTDEKLSFEEQVESVRRLVQVAHPKSVAVEGEITPLGGAGGEAAPSDHRPRLTDIQEARRFVQRTGVDALAVDIGQAHLHGRKKLRLNLKRLNELRSALSIPLVLHGASSVSPEDLAEAARSGISKINVGSNLKRSYFEALRRACTKVAADYNPYDVIGSGLAEDVLTAGRTALQRTVEDFMHLFGSAGRAEA